MVKIFDSDMEEGNRGDKFLKWKCIYKLLIFYLLYFSLYKILLECKNGKFHPQTDIPLEWVLILQIQIPSTTTFFWQHINYNLKVKCEREIEL